MYTPSSSWPRVNSRAHIYIRSATSPPRFSPYISFFFSPAHCAIFLYRGAIYRLALDSLHAYSRPCVCISLSVAFFPRRKSLLFLQLLFFPRWYSCLPFLRYTSSYFLSFSLTASVFASLSNRFFFSLSLSLASPYCDNDDGGALMLNWSATRFDVAYILILARPPRPFRVY